MHYMTTMIRYLDPKNPVIGIYTWFSRNTVHLTTYNTYVVIQSSENSYVIYEKCMFCAKGKDVVQKYNSWDTEEGFRYNFNLPQSFKNQYFNKRFLQACSHRPLFDMYDKPVVLIMMGLLNFRLGYGYGVNSDLKRGKFDFLGCGNIMHSESGVTYSTFYRYAAMTITSVEPDRGYEWYSFVKPFSFIVWLLIISTIPLSGMVLFLLYNGESFETKSLYDSVWDICRLILWDSIQFPTEPTTSFYIHSGSYLLFAMILFSAYSGIVTAFLISPPYLWAPIDTLEQLVQGPMKWVTRSPNFLMYLSASSYHSVLKAKMVITEFNSSISDGSKETYQLMLNNPVLYVTIGIGDEYVQMQFVDSNGQHKFHIGKERLSIQYVAFMFRKSTLYKEPMDNALLRLWETGIMLKLIKDTDNHVLTFHKPKRKAENEQYDDQNRTDQITLNQLVGPFILLIMGSCSALISIILELASKYWGRFLL